MRVAIATTTSRPGAVADNLDQIARFAARAGADGVDLLLTPEMSASGYGPDADTLATAEPAGDGPIFRDLAMSARRSGVVICAGFVETGDGGKLHLSHYAVFPDGRHVVQRKHRVTLYERPLEPGLPLIPPGPNHPACAPEDPGQPPNPVFNYFEVKGVRCALVICFDGGIQELNELLMRDSVDLVLCPCGAGGRREDRVVTDELRTPEGRDTYCREMERLHYPGSHGVKNCLVYRRAFAAVDMCGHDGRGRHHVGFGSIVTAMGEIAAVVPGQPNLDRQRPRYAFAEIDFDERLDFD